MRDRRTRSRARAWDILKTVSRYSIVALGVLVALYAAPAHAATAIAPLFHVGLNTITDNDAELFINKAGGATTVDIGDVFLGAIEIDTINNTAIGLGTTFNEVTGVFGLQVTSRVDLAGGLALFSFGAVTDLQGEFLAATGVDIGATPAGTFGFIFEDAAPNAVRDLNTFAGFTAQTSDGTLRLVLDLADGGISATAPIDTAAIPGFGEGQGLPVVFFGTPGVNIIDQFFPGIILGPGVTISGNGQVPAASLGEDFTIRTDTTFTTIGRVPYPATVTLIGAALLGLRLAQRRKARVLR